MKRVEQYELLPEDVRTEVETWMTTMERALPRATPSLADDVVSDLLAHLAEVATNTPSMTATELLEPLGDAQDYAALIAEEFAGTGSDDARRGSRAAGNIGVFPYDVRVPTAERVSSRWWNPTDPRIFVPRVFGIGWSINFGYLSVLLGIIRPDDEEIPFEHTSETALMSALAVPVMLSIAVVSFVIAGFDALPAQVPGQWGIDGEPNWYMPAWTSVGLILTAAIVPTAWAVYTTVAGRPKSARVGAMVFALLFGIVGAGAWTFTLVGEDTLIAAWMVGIWLALCLGAPFVMLVLLARDGIKNEIREAGLDR